MDQPTTIMPAFHTCPKEAAIIGRLLAGYGELEFTFFEGVKVAVGNSDIAARLLYRVRSEKTRQDIWDAIMRPVCDECSIEKEYELAFAAANYCRKLRNQYAHCHWWADPQAGLFFSNIEPSAQEKRGDIIMAFLHVDEALLQKQEAYFAQTQMRVYWLAFAVREAVAKKPIPKFSLQKTIQQPPLHNPPEQHPLPGQPKDPPPSGAEPDTEPAQ